MKVTMYFKHDKQVKMQHRQNVLSCLWHKCNLKSSGSRQVCLLAGVSCFLGGITSHLSKSEVKKSDLTFLEHLTSAERGTKTPALHLLGEPENWHSLMFQSTV